LDKEVKIIKKAKKIGAIIGCLTGLLMKTNNGDYIRDYIREN